MIRGKETNMFDLTTAGLSKEENLASMVRVVTGQSEYEPDPLALVSNTTALMASYLEDINWIGFYLMRNGELVLGPFQGKPACTRIKVGEGVCGTSVKERKTMLVADVDEFPGHIACDSASRSELVIPVIYNNEVIGVMDCDSPSLNRFSEEEAHAFEEITEAIASFLARI